MNIPIPEELREAGIAPSLVNYLHFVGMGDCKEDCPIHDLCSEIRERIDSFKPYPKVRGLFYFWYCPLYIYNVEVQTSALSAIEEGK